MNRFNWTEIFKFVFASLLSLTVCAALIYAYMEFLEPRGFFRMRSAAAILALIFAGIWTLVHRLIRGD